MEVVGGGVVCLCNDGYTGRDCELTEGMLSATNNIPYQ